MPLESTTYIDGLDAANPAPTDALSQGDDHIRLIKSALLATFPNIAGPITLSDEDINGLVTLISGVGVPTGTIVVWYGTDEDVPTGYGICNGSTYPKSDGSGNIVSPDLRDRVVMGAGTVAAQNTNYGSANQTATSASGGDHTHSTSGSGQHQHTSLSVAGHALTISEMPAHTHNFKTGTGGSAAEGGQGGTQFTHTTESAGSGAEHSHGISHSTADGAHSHTISTDGAHTHGVTVPVYQPAHALHYIMKL